jgi:hypothetical protein
MDQAASTTAEEAAHRSVAAGSLRRAGLLRIGLPDYETASVAGDARKIIGREDVRIRPATFTRLGAAPQRRNPAANWAGAGPYRTGNTIDTRIWLPAIWSIRRACVIDDGPQSGWLMPHFD